MSTGSSDKSGVAPLQGVSWLAGRIWRETARPFHRFSMARQKRAKERAKADKYRSALRFKFADGTVEPAGLALLADLVKRSQKFPGPIVEIGTLFGKTATHMALHKAPSQKIITVDTYSWNPWNLAPETHFELTSRILMYLVESGQVEQIKMDKNKFYEQYRGPAPSLVFLDAIHSYEQTKIDIEWAKSVGAKFISGHDYSAKFPGVQQIVHEHGGPKELGGTVFLLP